MNMNTGKVFLNLKLKYLEPDNNAYRECEANIVCSLQDSLHEYCGNKGGCQIYNAYSSVNGHRQSYILIHKKRFIH